MAFSERLARSVRKQLEHQAGLVEKKMFGGLAFLINGNMNVGIHGDKLVVRIAPEVTDAALEEPGARVFDITGTSYEGLAVDWRRGRHGSGITCKSVTSGKAGGLNFGGRLKAAELRLAVAFRDESTAGTLPSRTDAP